MIYFAIGYVIRIIFLNFVRKRNMAIDADVDTIVFVKTQKIFLQMHF